MAYIIFNRFLKVNTLIYSYEKEEWPDQYGILDHYGFYFCNDSPTYYSIYAS